MDQVPRLMIIDDAVGELQLICNVFKKAAPSMQITTSGSGDEALSLLRSTSNSKPKMILLDLRMPGKTGIDVLKELKSDPNLRKIPVCIFSNGDLEAEVCECYEQGASCFLKKPEGLEEMKKFAGHFLGLWFGFAIYCSVG